MTSPSSSSSSDLAEKLRELEFIELCFKAANLGELVVPNPGRSEREWDRLWERLEERFLSVGIEIPSRLKVACVCRLLRGVSLHLWHEAEQDAEKKDTKKDCCEYVARRDAFMLKLFPVSQEYQRLCRPVQEAGSPPSSTTQATTGGPTEPNNNEQPAGNNATAAGPESPLTDSTAATAKAPIQRAGRLSLPTVRAQVLLQKSRIQRLVSRHPELAMPSDAEFIKYANSLLRPGLINDEQPTSSSASAGAGESSGAGAQAAVKEEISSNNTLEEFLAALAAKAALQPQPVTAEPRANKRARRIKNSKKGNDGNAAALPTNTSGQAEHPSA
eukprot:Protomagalhaensia_wolfi_Nauph_80__236@NODE_1131_length_1707_cov_414_842926_g863_i0_p1_GENE_NODE_1131_length_1707_cov_414_842926_g863_i0NODE_1131_length_1707_cov_414_842926_g863_i0_p1_ORF_typecomplete_len330_score64_99HABP4_PAIRBP1/PF04774_15/1_1e03HABP4_PAIRBP1/PF04774_15/1_7_NODE_1131_length_1707_cov_414_842926_g863_i02541243